MEKSARQLMAEGAWFDAGNDEELAQLRLKAQELVFEFNRLRPSDLDRQRAILEELFGHIGEDVELWAPLQVDYGYNVSIGDHSFVNHGAYFMDGGRIEIGPHCFIGPDFGAYTAQHPLDADERATGMERSLPIVVEDGCWIGARVSVMAGVRIGEGSVIGAGSVVTKDIPPHSLAFGVPARVQRTIGPDDALGIRI